MFQTGIPIVSTKLLSGYYFGNYMVLPNYCHTTSMLLSCAVM